MTPVFEERQIKAVTQEVKALARPKDVVDLSIEFHDDWTGDPAAYIGLVITDELAKEPDFVNQTRDFQNQIRSIFDELGVDRFVYFKYRSVSEV
jgi:hypothetical protein